jgi:hypothetical protein
MAISEYFKQPGDWQQQTAQQSPVTMEQQKKRSRTGLPRTRHFAFTCRIAIDRQSSCYAFADFGKRRIE